MQVQQQSVNEFSQWQQNFLQEFRKSGKSENSLKCYRLDFQCFNEFLFKFKNDLALRDFNNEAVDHFKIFLEAKYQNINSIRRKLQTLRLFFDFLVKHDLYPENPIKKIATAPKSLLPPQPNTFEEVLKLEFFLKEQIAKAQTEMEKLKELRNHLIFLMIYHGGFTVSQLSQLKQEDMLLSAQSLRVLIKPAKRDPYSIPLPDSIVPVLNQYLADLRTYCIKQELHFTELFFNANAYRILNGGLSPRGLEEIFKKMSEANGVHCTPKSLRQSCILKWVNQHVATSTIIEWLGVAPSYNFSFYQKYYNENAHCQSYQDLVLH